MGANDGVRSKLKKAAKEANSAYRQGAIKQHAYVKKIKEATEIANKIGIVWRQQLTSIPDGESIWEKFVDGTEEAQKKIILQYSKVDIKKWVDETAKVGVKFQQANAVVEQLQLKEDEVYRLAKAAKEKEKLALQTLEQYVTKKANAKEIGGEAYKEFKLQFMNVAKLISKM